MLDLMIRLDVMMVIFVMVVLHVSLRTSASPMRRIIAVTTR